LRELGEKSIENEITWNEVYALCGKVISAPWIWQRDHVAAATLSNGTVVSIVNFLRRNLIVGSGTPFETDRCKRVCGRAPNPQWFTTTRCEFQENKRMIARYSGRLNER